MADRRVRFRSGRVVVGGSFPPSGSVPPVTHEHGPRKSQGPTHGQGVGLGLYLLTIGAKPPGHQQGPTTDNYELLVLSDAPLAYWRLGETSGTTVHDSSATGTFVGTYANTPTLGQTGIPGAAPNLAAKFASISPTSNQQQCARFGDVLTLAGTKATIEFWVAIVGSVVGFAPYVARGDTTWRVSTAVSSNTQVQFTFGAGQVTSSTVANLADGNYHHVVCTYDQAHLTIYVDSVQVGQTAWSTNLPTSSGKNVGIGYNSDQTTRYIQAVMDEVAVYNTALSAARVLAHYNAGIA